MKKYIILLFLISSLSAEKPFQFIWNFQINKTFTIDKFTKQIIVKNGQKIREHEIRDYIILTPQKAEKNKYHLKGRYYSYQKPLHKKAVYQLQEIYKLDFQMDQQGYYFVDRQYTMPSIRNVPVFPKENISPGYMWQEEAIELMEFNPPLTVPIHVHYQYTGIDEKKFKKPTAKIVFHYIFNHVFQHKHYDVPYKFIGASYSTMWYDLQLKLPVYIENTYDIGFIYANGTVIQYMGDLQGYYNLKRTVSEKKQVEKEIYDKLKKNKELKIKKSDEGIIIDFSDIYFQYKSDKLTELAKKKLNKISALLKQYTDFNVITKGHTDNIGSQEYNKTLSEKRAKNVLNYLIKKGAISNKQGSYKGYGKEKPIADNNTKEGRQKNRRVEIIISPE